MTDTHEHWIDQLSGYMDGDLVPEHRAALEAHLAECGACREALAELRQVVAMAHELGDAMPTRDLWPGIAAAIAAPLKSGGATVIRLPPAATAEGGPTGLLLSRRQLAAAAVVLMLISATATWFVGPGLAVRQMPGLAEGPAVTSQAQFASAVPEIPGVPTGLANELRSLESVLADAGARLDPSTLHIIEKNLAVIDRAIEDSRRALAVDPESEFLEEHLARTWERKLDYLQGAVRALEWAG